MPRLVTTVTKVVSSVVSVASRLLNRALGRANTAKCGTTKKKGGKCTQACSKKVAKKSTNNVVQFRRKNTR